MEQSILLAKLTLMLLRASVEYPEGLPPDYSVSLMPSEEVMPQTRALEMISSGAHGRVINATVRQDILVLTIREPTMIDSQRLTVSATTFAQTLHDLNKKNDPNALVRVVGFDEELLVPESTITKWLWTMGCIQCPMSIGDPIPAKHGPEIAILYLGAPEQRRSTR